MDFVLPTILGFVCGIAGYTWLYSEIGHAAPPLGISHRARNGVHSISWDLEWLSQGRTSRPERRLVEKCDKVFTMWATPFEILLANLRQQNPDPMYHMPKAEAYEKLKQMTGQDFGHNAIEWEHWGFKNEMYLNPPRFLQCLSNLRQELPATSLYFRTLDEAYKGLKELTGQDFGFDDKKWEVWGREHGYLL